MVRRVGLEIEYRGLFRIRRLVGLVQAWSGLDLRSRPRFARFTSC